MTRKLHTNTKIFFPNPHVVRVEYPDRLLESLTLEFGALCRKTYKVVGGTWGHTKLEYEQVKLITDEPPIPLHVTNAAGVQVVNLPALFNPSNVFVPRAYFCFKDELDLLQFRLSIDVNSTQLKMWPEKWFTIHEVIEKDEP